MNFEEMEKALIEKYKAAASEVCDLVCLTPGLCNPGWGKLKEAEEKALGIREVLFALRDAQISAERILK